MASLEYINFNPWREVVVGGEIAWESDSLAGGIERLPQIYWNDGSDWAEANHWALTKITDHRVDLATAKGLMKQLHAYACFLEAHDLEWRTSQPDLQSVR